MGALEQAYGTLLTGAAIVLALLIIASIIRSVLGPKISDRIIAVNMTGTMVISVIAVLSVYLNENYLVDVCLIYAMISFLGVVVLCKVYTGVYLQKKHRKADMGAIEENLRRQGIDEPEGESARWQGIDEPEGESARGQGIDEPEGESVRCQGIHDVPGKEWS